MKKLVSKYPGDRVEQSDYDPEDVQNVPAEDEEELPPTRWPEGAEL